MVEMIITRYVFISHFLSVFVSACCIFQLDLQQLHFLSSTWKMLVAVYDSCRENVYGLKDWSFVFSSGC